MCNIHGFVTKKYVGKAEEFMKDGFIAGGVRGLDSAGMAIVDTIKGEVDMQKIPVCGSIFLQDKVAARLMKAAMQPSVISIGHLRAATMGAVNYNNSHPFYIADQGKELVGVHNGTLSGWSTKKDGKFYDVDSEWALNHIFLEGFDAFQDFNGAYCFVWWQSDAQDVLNIALNDQRTMHVAFIEQGGMAYASEAGMLHWICERNGLTIIGDILKLADNFWYKFPVKEPEKFTKLALPKQTYSNYYSQYGGNRYSGTYKTTFEKVGEVLEAAVAKMKNTKPTVTMTEVKAAKEVGLQNVDGKFSPWIIDPDNGELVGMFFDGTTEYTAIIRNAYGLDFGPDTEFDVTCLGAEYDEKQTINLICSKPVKKEQAA